MGREDWYRRTTWSPLDEAEFHSRLKRSRGDFHKAQYLGIQAGYLAKAGMHHVALALLDQLLRDHPEPGELASTFLQKAECFVAIGNNADAIHFFRECLRAEAEYPNLVTTGKLDFAWFIALNRISDLYDQATSLVKEYEAGGGDWLPLPRFMIAATRAMIAHQTGDMEAAACFAALARKTAAEKYTGLRYHPTLCLVGELEPQVAKRLTEIDGVV